ncbi:MAG TPA: cation transporter [Candidatus Thermoplasmatota archaeon]|nr:cation transporter [Candidatus Thermoplasmatota archaeon]
MANAVLRETGKDSQAELSRRGLRLAYLTVGWNVVEGAVAIFAALAAGSVVLLGFGVDSFVESASGAVIVWRFLAHRRAADPETAERIERRAQKLVAISLLALAAYVGVEASTALWEGREPEPSFVGIALAAVSLVVMGYLARAKRALGRSLHSRAVVADAAQTQACFYLSAIVLAGVGLNAAFGWWWADPVAALLITVPLAKEAKDAWQGKDCC